MLFSSAPIALCPWDSAPYGAAATGERAAGLPTGPSRNGAGSCPTTAAFSLLDRLLHHNNLVATDGESYRMREARTRSGGPPSKR
jgi:hypothetical protein